MPELQLWWSVLNRDDIQDLDPVDRMALFSIAATVADNQPTPDGFLPRAGLRTVPWSDGVADLRKHLPPLIEAGFLTMQEEPLGYFLTGWLDRVTRYQSGNDGSRAMAWGQKSTTDWTKIKKASATASKKHRDKKRDEQVASDHWP